MTSKEGELHLLKRITILDKQCSAPLYDKVISWKTDDHSPGTAAKIISLFNSIAFTFNDGNRGPDGKLKDSNDRIRRVIFEQSNEQHRKSKSNYNKYSTGLPSLGGRTNTSKASTSASRFMMAQNPQSQNNSEMEIYFQTTNCIHVAIFFKPAYYIEDSYEPQLLRDIAHEFLHRYEAKLREHELEFQKLAKDQEAARNNYSFMPDFEEFQPVIEDSSGFTIKDIASPTQHNKKFDLGTHILPLSSDLIIPSSGSSQPGFGGSPLEHDLALGQVVQPKFFPPLQQSPQTPQNQSQPQFVQPQDEQVLKVQKEQRSHRMALQQGLQPPPSSTHTSTASNNKGQTSTTTTPTNAGSIGPEKPVQSQTPNTTTLAAFTVVSPNSAQNPSHRSPHEALKGHQLDDDEMDGFGDDD